MAEITVNGHTMLKAPVLVRSPKLSSIGRGMSEAEQPNRWNLVREQLITLWASDPKSSSAKEFEVFLTEDINKSCMNLKTFNQICHFLLGIINKEERDKLIQWPIINRQGQVNFRKAVSKIVKDLSEKYSFLNVHKLQDSYLMNPDLNQKKILNFIMRLSNVAIYLAVDDPYMFPPADTKSLSKNEVEIAASTIKQVRLSEENDIQKNEFPLSNFENNRMIWVNKCVSLKQENFNLKNELNVCKQYLFDKGILRRENYNLDCLRETYNGRLNEQKEMNKELELYYKVGQEIIKKVNALESPVQLTRQDFGLSKRSDFTDAAAEAYDKLIKTFECIKMKDVSARKKEEYYRSLLNLKKVLITEQEVLRSFINKGFVVKNNHTC